MCKPNPDEYKNTITVTSPLMPDFMFKHDVERIVDLILHER